MENTTVFVPMMLFGWVPITILLFWVLKPHHAVLCSILGGWLFLPMFSYDLPGLPAYGKDFAISLGLIGGTFLSGRRLETSFQWKSHDLPMVIFCCCPLATSLTNNLGLYDGLSGIFDHIVAYAVPYFIGRIYFNTTNALRDLCLGIIVAGVIYIPFCLYEIRMSPQLHATIYGFFQHSFLQHIRYGGYRPIIFMQHGLMVSLWMALSTVMTFWYWRISENKNLAGIPLSVICLLLAGTTILCKSANGWTLFILGISCYLLYKKFHTSRIFSLLIIFIPLYLIIRISGVIPTEEFLSLASFLFDEERVASLAVRLNQEDLIRVEALKSLFFGWGEFGRGLPRDIVTGEILVLARDSLWVIIFQTYGFVGLLSLYTSLLSGPWLVLNNDEALNKNFSSFFQTLIIALSLIMTFFIIDSLFNSMKSPLYFAISGSLITIYLQSKKEESVKA